MERVLTHGSDAVALPGNEDSRTRLRSLVVAVVPLWRHLVWLIALTAVGSFAVAVRIDVQRTQKDFERTVRTQREAHVLQDRLRLELDSRRRASAMEGLAESHAMIPNPNVVHVEGM